MIYEAEYAAVPVPFRVDHQHAFEGGFVEIRRYYWNRPIRQEVHGVDGAVSIDLALTSRPEHTRVDRIEQQAGPLTVAAGRLIIIIPGVSYWLEAPEGSVRSLQCTIRCERFERIAGEAIDWLALGPFAGEMRSGLNIEGHLAALYNELVRSNIGKHVAILALVDMICVELCRQFRKGRPVRPDVMHGGLAAWRLRLIADRVHSDGHAPRVVELADLCGLTERQLRRAFKAETGQNIGRYIDEATIERAHRLLTTTRLSVTDIARSIGFARADTFNQAYRRATGILPKQAREH